MRDAAQSSSELAAQVDVFSSNERRICGRVRQLSWSSYALLFVLLAGVWVSLDRPERRFGRVQFAASERADCGGAAGGWRARDAVRVESLGNVYGWARRHRSAALAIRLRRAGAESRAIPGNVAR